MKTYTLTESELQELLMDKEKFYEQQVQNPYPTESQSNTAYKKGFYEAWDYLVKALLPTEEVGDKPECPNWYSKQDIHTWLTSKNYSREIADELSELIAEGYQGCFKKGWEKGYNDFNPEKGTTNYTYFNSEEEGIKEDDGMLAHFQEKYNELKEDYNILQYKYSECVASKIHPQPSASLASHSCTIGNSIQQEALDFFNWAKSSDLYYDFCVMRNETEKYFKTNEKI